MKNKPNPNGGPAFPVLGYEYKASGDLHPSPTVQEGMSLRDWFAGMALQGIKSNPELCRICSHVEGLTQQEAIAKMSYVDADAMLKEREK